MEDQQSIAEPKPSQALTPPDGKSTEVMQQVNPDGSDANAVVPASPSMNSSKPSGRKNAFVNFLKLGLWKLWILMWKNFLFRRRSWILLFFQYFFAIAGTIITILVGGFRGLTTNAMNAKSYAESDITDSFNTNFSGKTLLWTVSDQVLIPMAKEITGSITAPTWEQVSDVEEVQNRFNRMSSNEFVGAIIFESLERTQVKYTIRLPDVGESYSNTDKLFLDRSYGESRLTNAGYGNDDSYISKGVLGLQILLDNVAAAKLRNTNTALSPQVILKTFPYPSHKTDPAGAMFVAFGVCFLIFIDFCNFFLAKTVASEKQTGVKELMKLCGYPGWMQWLAWYLIPFFVDGIAIILVVILLKFVPGIPPLHDQIALENSDVTLFIVILFLTEIANNAFVFFICSLVKSPTQAIGVMEVCLVSLLLAMPAVLGDHGVDSLRVLMGLSILPHACFYIAINYFFAFEILSDGAQWSLLGASRPDSSSEMCLGYAILMLIVDIVLYQSLAVYLDNVLPSDYGIREPWYFPVQPLVNPIIALIKNRRKGKAGDPNTDLASQIEATENKAGSFEPYQGSATVGVDVQNLVKKFDGTKIAVSGVSVKMYDGEIFALLGHNGAGKTTLISMLTGMFAPTNGTAKVGGHDIIKDMDKVRQSLGFCPQHDMLFSNLTVMEHLKIFGQMKGQSSKKVKAEAKGLLSMMNLSEKANTVSKKLSGGQKRKLCLGMALIGEAKVVVLDEPTSGMDPEARRSIWDILLQMRGKRTILLTTHYMEEADVLGDRIGIMAEGKLQCCGSPSFLKSFYGTGYTLKLSLLPGADKYAILSLVQKHISNATIKPIHMPTEVFISLPSETATSSALSSLFSSLTEKKNAMLIESIGLSVATMDEVFVKVGELSDRAAVDFDHSTKPIQSKPSVRTQASEKQAIDDSSETTTSNVLAGEKGEASVTGSSNAVAPTATSLKPIPVKSRRFTCNLKLLLMQAFALFIKRFIHTRRKIGFPLLLLIFPALMMILAVVLTNDNLEPALPLPKLKITLDSYKTPVTLFSSDDQARTDTMKKVIGSSAKYAQDIEAQLIASGKAHFPKFKDFYIVAGELTAAKYTAWFNIFSLHSAPLAINLASNVRGATFPTPMTFSVTHHPLQTPETQTMKAATSRQSIAGTTFFLIAVFALSMLWVIVPTEERLNKSKQLQLMTGVHPLIYWGVMFAWDFCVYMVVAVIMIAILGIFGKYAVFSYNGGLGVIFILLLSYGFNVIPLAYLISNIPKSVAGAAIIIILFLVIPYLLVGIVQFFSKVASIWLSRLFPLISFFECLSQFVKVASGNLPCNYLGEREKKIICDTQSPIGTAYSELKVCCACGTFPGVTCHKPPNYLTWEKDVGQGFQSQSSQQDKEPGIGQLLLILFIISIITQTMHILVELGVLRLIRRKMIKGDEWNFKDEVNDEDVNEEKQRVADILMTGAAGTEALVVDNLCKNYGSLSAVSKLTFGVHHGECFGLLGTNGAGKTTTFRIITGDELQSVGNAFQGNLSLTRNRRTLISHIGYCPQFDAFIPYLTGKENLQLFARLRGVPMKQVSKEAGKWLEKVGLTESRNVQSKKYSGGMKRRLSAAIAMIGDPALVLLDEPTSGVDPVSRRQFWKVLESAKASGKSIILTSHSMDECETLCARLGIMVNGQLQCIGGVQHLKHKYAQGYSLTLRLKSQFQGVGPPQPEQFQSQQVPQQQFQQQPQQHQFQQQPQQQFQFQNASPQQFQQPQQFPQPQYSRVLQNPYQQQQSQPSQQQQSIFQQQQQLFKYEETFHQVGQELNPNSDQALRRLHAEITEKFHPCILRDQHETVLQYQIENAALGWDVIYKTLEDLKKSHGDIIEDYSVSETSLEEVFLSFSRKQYPPRDAKIPLCKRIITCQF